MLNSYASHWLGYGEPIIFPRTITKGGVWSVWKATPHGSFSDFVGLVENTCYGLLNFILLATLESFGI